MPTLTSEALATLADDLVASAWLLPDEDPLRAYLSMLASLPAEEDAWLEVLEPWGEDMRRGARPDVTHPGQLAAIGAVAVAALRASRGLPAGSPLAWTLRHAARWGFWVVRPDAH